MNNQLAIQSQLSSSNLYSAIPIYLYIVLVCLEMKDFSQLGSQLKAHSQKRGKVLRSDFVLSELNLKQVFINFLLLIKNTQSASSSGKLLASYPCELDMVSYRCKPVLACQITCHMKYLDFHLQLMKFSSFFACFLFLSLLATLVFLKDLMYFGKIINGLDFTC